MSIYREVASDMMTPVRFGDGERDFVRAWTASGMLRRLREQDPDLFNRLLGETLAGNTGTELRVSGAVLPPEPGP